MSATIGPLAGLTAEVAIIILILHLSVSDVCESGRSPEVDLTSSIGLLSHSFSGHRESWTRRRWCG